MARSTRRYGVIAKTEATYGVDAVPTGAANGMLVKNLQVQPLNINLVDRALLRPYFGASEQLAGVKYKEVSFDIEAVGGATAGVAPPWGVLAKACAMAETLVAVTRADYTPVTLSLGSVSMYCYLDGVEHKLIGARGDWSLSFQVGEIPMWSFRFMAIDGGAAVVSTPTIDVSTWQVPQVVQDAFTPDFKLGGSVSPSGAPAITGGTDFPSTGLTLQGGHAMNYTDLINLREVDITDRVVTGHTDLDQTAAQEVSRLADVLAATLSSISLLHGTVGPRRFLAHLPTAQFINPTYVDRNQRLLGGYDLRCVPAAGNDEFRFVTSF